MSGRPSQRPVVVTVRMGWRTTTDSMRGLREEIRQMLDKFVPHGGRLDVDVRRED